MPELVEGGGCKLESMKKMQSGEILNFIQGFPSENRAVLHTAVRDFFDNQQEAAPARQAAELARAEFDKLKIFIRIENGVIEDVSFEGSGCAISFVPIQD